MRILPVPRGALLCFLVYYVFAVSFCNVNGKTVEVVGTGECADCGQSNFKPSQAFSGLRVAIDCKVENGEFKTRGIGELDEEGKFKVSLPQEIVEDGKLKEECYAQLHSASATPCPAHDGLESSKIVLKTKSQEKHTFGLVGKLKFSPVTCASAFFWPHFKYPSLPTFPPLPKFPHPKFNLPPSKSFGHPFPFPPKYKKPCPPPIPKVLPPPVPKAPPPPVPKVLPPPEQPKPLPPKPPVIKKPCPPVKKPLPPIPKVLPPPVPIYKPKPPVPKVLPPPVPIYKPKPPVPIYKPKPPVPIYKPKHITTNPSS
ncbi:proline-rich protein 4-like [Melia azedarach]|uniref:Proline-rich protein 4-like n=1 Tax=Melia azedarach TaxID=155640 RepID=A0ACC1Y2G9_MELAZ|nr:proline-rich protein 4-like [Melia azedarach]